MEEKVTQLLENKNALEKYIDDFCSEMNVKLAGKSFNRVQLICSHICSIIDFWCCFLMTEYCLNEELEKGRIVQDLDPKRQLTNDKAASPSSEWMNTSTMP